jgi:hypothetical protein
MQDLFILKYFRESRQVFVHKSEYTNQTKYFDIVVII